MKFIIQKVGQSPEPFWTGEKFSRFVNEAKTYSSREEGEADVAKAQTQSYVGVICVPLTEWNN